MPNKYGPKDELPLERNMTMTVFVPKGYKGVFRFAKDAAWPQSICIYYENDGLQLAAKKFANVSDGDKMDNWETPYNNAELDKHYIISGWYYYDGTWHQSNFRSWNQPGDSITIGFNDGGNDQDYNDIMTIFKLVKQ